MKTIITIKRLSLLLALVFLSQAALIAQPANRPGPQRGDTAEQQRMMNPEQARAMMLMRLAQMDNEQLENLHQAIGELRKMSPRQRQAFAERTRARMAEGRGAEELSSREGDDRRGPPPALRGMSEEERQQLRERVRDMTPEEREALRREMREGADERRPEVPRGRSRE
jgi:hypothetical protein